MADLESTNPGRRGRTVAAAIGGSAGRESRYRSPLSGRRRIAGFGLTLLAGPLLTLVLSGLRSEEALTAEALTYQLLVIAVALIGGALPASFAAVLSGLTLDFVFVAPVAELSVARPVHLVALLLYLVNGLLVSLVVDRAARRYRDAVQSSIESGLLSAIAGDVLRGDDALKVVVARTAEHFGFPAARVVVHGATVQQYGPSAGRGEPITTVRIDERATLEIGGPPPLPEDERVMSAITSQIAAVLQQRDLEEAAARLRPLAEVDRVRSALLAAVGHDLRRPLAVATAAVSSLRSPGAQLSAPDRDTLLDSAEQSLETLARLVTDLLDVSRVQAGVLAVALAPLEVEDVLPAVLEDLHATPGSVIITASERLPEVLADEVLLQRVLANLLANALRFSPPCRPPRLRIAEHDGHVQIAVIDHGPGVPDDRREQMFEPFQRLGDTDNSTGTGLGLALSRGFAEGMGATLEAEDTPGGGLTMVLSLPIISTADEREQNA